MARDTPDVCGLRQRTAFLAFLFIIIPLAASRPNDSAYCTTAADCSLNGDCVNNVCVCDSHWSGSPACDVLALLPTDKATGYHNASASTWGGVPLQDTQGDGLWHLYVAQMLNGCDLMSWKNNSVIVRAVSASPGGPYSYAETVLPAFSHNPKAIRAPDGTYLVYGIGGGMWRPNPANCAGGHAFERGSWGVDAQLPTPVSPTQDGCGLEPLNGGCGIFIASSSSLLGPWTVQPLIIVDQNRSALLQCAHTNPSPVFFDNGTVLMAFNAGYCNGQLETIGLATAPHWSRPYTLVSPDPIFLDAGTGKPHQCEDPSLWKDSRGFHMMVHNQEGPQVALYAHSVNGFNWTLHGDTSNPGPYNRTIVWSDGTSVSLEVERPQLLWGNGLGQLPTHLINGALYGNGSSFTLFRPLAQQAASADQLQQQKR